MHAPHMQYPILYSENALSILYDLLVRAYDITNQLDRPIYTLSCLITCAFRSARLILMHTLIETCISEDTLLSPTSKIRPIIYYQ